MGKTLKRQRAKAAAAAAAAPPPSAAHHQQQKRHKGAIAAAAPPPPTTASAWTAAVSSALERRRWDEACRLLDAMRRAGKAPKLGAIQRWVRDADAAGDEAVAARVICGVLRAAEVAAAEGAAAASVAPSAQHNQQQQQQQGVEEAAASVDAAAAAVIRHAPWSPPDPAPAPPCGPATPAVAPAAPTSPSPTSPPKFHLIPRAPGAVGADSFVAGAAPVSICAFPPGSAVRWDDDAQRAPVARADVPFVPGAFVLVNALSPRECGEVLRAGRSLGFSREVDYAFGGGAATAPTTTTPTPDPSSSAARRAAAAAAGLEAASGRPAEGCVWLADASVLEPLWKRVRHLLPQELGGGPLVGINSRWRLYRYTPGAVFRPHVDGAWPASGLDDKGRYLFDAKGGEVWSRLTFLMYLNGADEEEEEGAAFEEGGGGNGGGDGSNNNNTISNGGTFSGGSTTFFSPAIDGSARLHARGVKPRRGNVLVFPHGDTAGALVHEGSAVTRGAKYVVRTEVLYALPPKDPVSGRRKRPPPEAAAGLGLSGGPQGGGGGGRG